MWTPNQVLNISGSVSDLSWVGNTMGIYIKITYRETSCLAELTQALLISEPGDRAAWQDLTR